MFKPIDIDNLFALHGVSGDQAQRCGRLRAAGKVFAQEILDSTPPGADQSAAIRKVREAVFTSSAAIACGENLPVPTGD